MGDGVSASGGKTYSASFAKGGTISAVHPGSIAEEAGLEPGDRLVSINGHILRDLIDYRYYAADEQLSLAVAPGGVSRPGMRLIEVERDYDRDLGLEFTEPLFDGMRQCNNHCPFCFVRQMPKGMRPTLYLRDDDYRLSFLLGNYVTLTNLTEGDWQRIKEQHLSPLYVSIHATDPQVRRRILGNPGAPDIVPQIRRLGQMGIQVHGQIVISPGVNDGQALERSIVDLAALWPTVLTLALVPVGLTRFHDPGPGQRVRLLRPDEAAEVLCMAGSYIQCFRRRLGRTWLYPTDELYLLAGEPVPESRFYDTPGSHGVPPQRENGVGLVRSLLNDWDQTKESVSPGSFPGGSERTDSGVIKRDGRTRITLVCGTLIAPILSDLALELGARAGIDVRVQPVVNRLFGESVTVSGLLSGKDVLLALAGADLGDHLFLPRAMFDAGERFTLDGLTPETIGKELGGPVTLASTMSEVLSALQAFPRPADEALRGGIP